MVRRGQLEEPLLPDHKGHFSAQGQQHSVDVDVDAVFAGLNRLGRADRSLDTRRSGRWSAALSGALSGRWRSGRFDGDGGDDGERVRQSKSKRQLRNPIKKKSLVRRAAHSAANEPAYFLQNLIYGVLLWPKWSWDAIRSQKKLSVLSLKAGIAAGLVSIICVVNMPAPYNGLSTIAIWAVVTIDLLSEANVGLSLSKGVNRVAGTFSAGALAVMLTQLGPDVPSSVYPYYVVFWVTFGGFVLRFLKGVPPLKDQWGYAFTVATVAFHILLLTTYLQPERVTLPLLRFCMILGGFFLWSLMNLAFMPVFAGDTLHKLVAKNFDTAADLLSRCVTEYTNFKLLDHVPDILSGNSEDDKIHQAYHEIVMSDSDVDKLLNAVNWEPCHGPFFRGYPWHLYDDITDYLRYTLYDIIALDSCLRASIQAPKHLREIFSQEMQVIAAECSKVLHTLSESMRTLRKFPSRDIMCQAEEAALALQHKIYIHTLQLLGKSAVDSPRYPLYAATSHEAVAVDPWLLAGIAEPHSSRREKNDSKASQNELLSSDSLGRWCGREGSKESGGQRVRISDNDGEGTRPKNHSAPVPIPHQQVSKLLSDSGGRSVLRSNSGSGCSKEIQRTVSWSPGQPGSGSSESVSRHQQSQVSSETNDDGRPVASGMENVSFSLPDGFHVRTEKTLLEEAEGPFDGYESGWREKFMQRRSSLGENWEGTLERISALSLVKFASLLIEVVAKMHFVVDSIDELSVAANFKETGG